MLKNSFVNHQLVLLHDCLLFMTGESIYMLKREAAPLFSNKIA